MILFLGFGLQMFPACRRSLSLQSIRALTGSGSSCLARAAEEPRALTRSEALRCERLSHPRQRGNRRQRGESAGGSVIFGARLPHYKARAAAHHYRDSVSDSGFFFIFFPPPCCFYLFLFFIISFFILCTLTGAHQDDVHEQQTGALRHAPLPARAQVHHPALQLRGDPESLPADSTGKSAQVFVFTSLLCCKFTFFFKCGDARKNKKKKPPSKGARVKCWFQTSLWCVLERARNSFVVFL